MARLRSPLLLASALLFIALNARTALAGVPPVLDDIRAELSMSNTAAGLLTTLPVLCFAVAAPLGPVLARRLGDEALLLWCMVVLALGQVLRIVPAIGPLFAGTLVLGVAIAITNVVIPAVIKRDYARPGTMMGLYSTALSASAAIPAALTVPLEGAFGRWTWALAFWAVPAVLAALFWLPAVIARHGDPLPPRPPVASLWRDRTAWLVTGFFASQSTLFYATLAWVPDIMRAQGISSSTAGVLLSVAMGLGAPSALVVPVIAAKMRRQTPLAAGAVGLWTAGLLGLLLAPSGGALIWMILIGLGQGAGISLSLTLFVLRTPDGAHAAAMSGMANTVAYGLAAVGPFALGALHDLSGGWQLPIAVMLGICGTMLLCGLGASKPKMVLER